MSSFKFYKPDNMEDLLKVKEELGGRALILAGGTNLLIYIKEGSIREGTLVDIKSLKELKGISGDNGYIEIGAGVTIAEILESPLLNDRVPFFTDTLKNFANPLVRNMASLGGNIADASPIGDTIPSLLVLNGRIKAACLKGERSVPLDRLFKGPGESNLKPDEVIRTVQFSIPERGKGTFIKLGLRNGTSCSVTSVAVWLAAEDGRVEDIRIAFGGVAPIPLRLKKTESLFKGEKLDEEKIRALSGEIDKEISPITDVRGSAEYRKQVSVRLLSRAVRICMGMEE